MDGKSKVIEKSDNAPGPRLQQIARVRLVAGYLGEQGQQSWWSSELFSATAPRFCLPHVRSYRNQPKIQPSG